jgi:hypothetical protein
MLINPPEKDECWSTLLNLRNSDYSENCIIIGDLNIIGNNAEKRGGVFGREPFRDNIEEIIMAVGLTSHSSTKRKVHLD